MSQDPRWSAETEETLARAMRPHDPWDTATPKQQAQCRTYAVRTLTALADAGLLAARRECGNTIDAPFLGLDPLTCDQPAGHATPHSQAIPGHTLPATWDLQPDAPAAQWVDITSDEPAAPRVWAMPTIPDHVQAVTDRDGHTIRRAPDGGWIFDGGGIFTGAKLGWTDMDLVRLRGPVTEIADGSGT